MGKYWCKNCKVFVENSTIGKKTHDASNKHKFNVQKAINSLHVKHKLEQQEALKAQKEYERIQNELSGTTSSYPDKVLLTRYGRHGKNAKGVHEKQRSTNSGTLKGNQAGKQAVGDKSTEKEPLIGAWQSVGAPVFDYSKDKTPLRSNINSGVSNQCEADGIDITVESLNHHEHAKRCDTGTKKSSAVDIDKLLDDEDAEENRGKKTEGPNASVKPKVSMFKKRGKKKI